MKLKTILAAAAVALGMISCNNEANFERHYTYFSPMHSVGTETYADQTLDSVRVISSDSWKLSNDCEWFEIWSNNRKAPFEVNIPAGYESSDRLEFRIQPNTTGKTRKHQVSVSSSFDEIGVVSQYLVQYPYLDIKQPGVIVRNEGNEVKYEFTQPVPGSGVYGTDQKPFIKFAVYSDDATLTSNDRWLVPEKTEGFKKDEIQQVFLNIEKNNTNFDRQGTLVLTSNGVSTTITIKQPVANRQTK